MKKALNNYQWILKAYPETISKEQLYKICQVSKKTAEHYLVHGLIPCIDSGKKTRKYIIKTIDVVAFLEKRDLDPCRYLAPIGWYKHNHRPHRPRIHSLFVQRKLYTALETLLQNYPDILTPAQIVDITGYSYETIIRWCSKNKLKNFYIRKSYHIPKSSLLEYLTANGCHAINDTAKEHILITALALSTN